MTVSCGSSSLAQRRLYLSCIHFTSATETETPCNCEQVASIFFHFVNFVPVDPVQLSYMSSQIKQGYVEGILYSTAV